MLQIGRSIHARAQRKLKNLNLITYVRAHTEVTRFSAPVIPVAYENHRRKSDIGDYQQLHRFIELANEAMKAKEQICSLVKISNLIRRIYGCNSPKFGDLLLREIPLKLITSELQGSLNFRGELFTISNHGIRSGKNQSNSANILLIQNL